MEQETMITVCGKLVEIGETQTFNKFTKRMATISDCADKYPNYYPFTFKGGGVRMLEGFGIGDMVKVSGYVNGRRYQKKDETGKPVGKVMYFLEVSAVSCEAYDPNAPQESGDDQGDEQMPDDLPF